MTDSWYNKPRQRNFTSWDSSNTKNNNRRFSRTTYCHNCGNEAEFFDDNANSNLCIKCLLSLRDNMMYDWNYTNDYLNYGGFNELN